MGQFADIDLRGVIATVRKSIEVIDSILQLKDSVREEIIKTCRDIIRLSGDAITYVHLGELEKANESIEKAKELVEKVLQLVDPHPELKYSGIVNNALSEFVEAKLVLTLVSEGRVPSFEELGFHYIPYLNGLCDFVGELKRMAIDAIHRDDYAYARKLLQIMEGVYSELRKLDYPDALTPGLRHKVDVMRRIIEDLRAFMVDMEKRWTLIKLLERSSNV